MSTRLPRAVGATPTGGGSRPGSELRDFRKASPFDDESEICFDRNRMTPSRTDEDTSLFREKYNSGDKIKPSRAVSTPIQSGSCALPSQESRRMDRRFWPKDTRGILEICEQGYALQQEMQASCRESAESLNMLADSCESSVNTMVKKMEGTLQMIQDESLKPANVDWKPIFSELNQHVAPEIVKTIFGGQEAVTRNIQERIASQLEQEHAKISQSLDDGREAQRVDMARLKEEIREVQKGAIKFEEYERKSQEEIRQLLAENQATFQSQIKEVVGQELKKVMNTVEKNRHMLNGLEPLLEGQLKKHLQEAVESEKQNSDQGIKQIQRTLHTDLARLFSELAVIQKGLNLPFCQPYKGRRQSVEDEVNQQRLREYATQTDDNRYDTGSQTDNYLLEAELAAKKKKEKKGQNKLEFPKAIVAVQQKLEGSAAPETDDLKKKHVRERMMKPQYDVAVNYHTRGWAQAVARSAPFEQVTFVAIALNAIWIAIDTDHNHAQSLVDANTVFQVADNLFCFYFLIELCIRFTAFRKKCACLRDHWFVFDTLLVLGMIAETWVLTGVVLIMRSNDAEAFKVGNLSILRLARLAKIFRTARLTRLLRLVPELVMILKGIGTACRSVWFFVLLVVTTIYIFAVAFVQLTKETSLGAKHFPSVTRGMGYLLLDGVLPIYAPIVKAVSRDNPALQPFILIFILLVSVTMVNMLVGVLCEIVRQVSVTEKEELTITHVTQQLKKVMGEFKQGSSKKVFPLSRGSVDAGNESMIRTSRTSVSSIDDLDFVDPGLGTLSRQEFEEFVTKDKVLHILQDVGVDPIGLVDMADVIFEDKGTHDQEGSQLGITFVEFIDVVLNLRGSNPATVKDVKETQRILKQTMFESRSVNKKCIKKEVGDFRNDMTNQLLQLVHDLHKDSSDSDEDASMVLGSGNYQRRESNRKGSSRSSLGHLSRDSNRKGSSPSKPMERLRRSVLGTMGGTMSLEGSRWRPDDPDVDVDEAHDEDDHEDHEDDHEDED